MMEKNNIYSDGHNNYTMYNTHKRTECNLFLSDLNLGPQRME